MLVRLIKNLGGCITYDGQGIYFPNSNVINALKEAQGLYTAYGNAQLLDPVQFSKTPEEASDMLLERKVKELRESGEDIRIFGEIVYDPVIDKYRPIDFPETEITDSADSEENQPASEDEQSEENEDPSSDEETAP